MKRLAPLLLSAALTFAAGTALAQVKITELPAAAALTGSEPVPIVQGAATVRTTAGAIAALAGGGGGATSGTFVTQCYLGTGNTACAIQQGFYIRVGNIVNWSIALNMTGASATFDAAVDLPVASNFGDITDATGVCGTPVNNFNVGRVSAVVADDRLLLNMRATSTSTSHPWSCSGSYRVL